MYGIVYKHTSEGLLSRDLTKILWNNVIRVRQYRAYKQLWKYQEVFKKATHKNPNVHEENMLFRPENEYITDGLK